MEVLNAIIRNNPRALLKADKDGLTPVHEYLFENKYVETELLPAMRKVKSTTTRMPRDLRPRAVRPLLSVW